MRLWRQLPESAALCAEMSALSTSAALLLRLCPATLPLPFSVWFVCLPYTLVPSRILPALHTRSASAWLERRRIDAAARPTMSRMRTPATRTKRMRAATDRRTQEGTTSRTEGQRRGEGRRSDCWRRRERHRKRDRKKPPLHSHALHATSHSLAIKRTSAHEKCIRL